MSEQDAETDEAPEDEDELSSGQFIALIIFVILSFAIIGFLIWAGYNSWRWELALPLGALALLLTRVGKRSAHRVLSKTVDIAEIIEELGEEKPSLEDVKMSPETRRVLFRHSPDVLPDEQDEDSGVFWTFLLIYFVMIFVAIFWYGFGMIFGLIFG